MHFSIVVAVILLAAGCSDEPDNGHQNHVTTNNGTTATNNTTGTPVDTYADGLTKAGAAGVEFTLVSAEPAPPDVGENTWTLRVVDGEGAPVDGATVTVTPFMPAHDHGTSPADYSGAFVDDGTYVAGPFNLFMPGVWEVTVTVEGAAEDSVVFAFELEG